MCLKGELIYEENFYNGNVVFLTFSVSGVAFAAESTAYAAETTLKQAEKNRFSVDHRNAISSDIVISEG